MNSESTPSTTMKVKRTWRPTCSKCNEQGHYAKSCKGPSMAKNKSTQVSSGEGDQGDIIQTQESHGSSSHASVPVAPSITATPTSTPGPQPTPTSTPAPAISPAPAAPSTTPGPQPAPTSAPTPSAAPHTTPVPPRAPYRRFKPHRRLKKN